MVETSAQTASNYSIMGRSVFTATRSTDDYSKAILDTSFHSGNTIYTLTISNVTDLNGNALTGPNVMQFYGSGRTDSTQPTLLFALLVDGNTVCLHFSEPMEQRSSENVGNYTLKENRCNSIPVDIAELT